MCPNIGHPEVIPCHNFDILVLQLIKINHHSKAETISKLTVHSRLLQNYFSPANILKIMKIGQPVKPYRTPPSSNTQSSATQKCCGVVCFFCIFFYNNFYFSIEKFVILCVKYFIPCY